MAEPNMTLKASDIDKAILIGTLLTSDVNLDDYISIYDTSANEEPKQRKVLLSSLKALILDGISIPTPSTDDFGRAIIVGSDGIYKLGASITPIYESFIVNVSDWTENNNIAPFGFSAGKTLSIPIITNDQVELINNSPQIFAKYGINASPPVEQAIDFYAVEKPTETIVLRVRIWRA